MQKPQCIFVRCGFCNGNKIIHTNDATSVKQNEEER